MQMQHTKFAAEFKSEAVKQVIDKGHAVVDVAKRLGIPELPQDPGPTIKLNVTPAAY